MTLRGDERYVTVQGTLVRVTAKAARTRPPCRIRTRLSIHLDAKSTELAVKRLWRTSFASWSGSPRKMGSSERTAMTISIEDQIKEVARELAMRRRVYPRWVNDGRMTQAEADRKWEAMKAAHDTLLKLKAEEDSKGCLL